MIDLGRPALHADGVTVFADHADDHVYHYVPDGPTLRVDAAGDPELLLLKYQLAADAVAVLGNGLLTVTVDLAVPADRLTRLRSKLAARTGLSGLTLAPVSAESGRADLTLLGASTLDGAPATDAAATFLVRPLAVGTPLLYGDKGATFSVVLTAEGATLVEQAMRAGGLPLGVVYQLHATGIRPALRATISARWHDVYSFYENRLSGGKLLLATDIGPTVEGLVHDELIKVDIDELVPEAERSDANHRALDEVQRYVLQQLFTPTLGRQPPPPDAEAEGLAAIGTAIKDIFGLFSMTYRLRQIDRNELKTFRYELSTAQAEVLVLSPQGSFDTVLAGRAVDRLVREVPAAADPEMVFDVGAARDLATDDIDRLEVVLHYGDRDVSVVLDRQAPRAPVSIWYEPALGPAVEWSYTVFFTPASGDVDQVTSMSRTTDARVIRIDPRELYDRVATRVVAQGIPFDRYPRVLIDLRYTQPASGWTADSTLELGPQALEVSQAVRVSPDRPLVLQRRLRYVDTAGRTTTLDWAEVDPGVVVVGDPAPDIVDVQLVASARFGTVVARLIVELRPHSEPGRVDTRVLTGDAPVAGWAWAPTGGLDATDAAGGGDRGYDYRVTVHTVAGEVKEGQWRPGPPGKLVVGEGFAALRAISLYLVGGTLATRGLFAVKVRFAYRDDGAELLAEHEVLVTDPSQPVQWSYPVADLDRLAYTVELTGVRTDGQLVPAQPITATDLLLIAPLP